MRHIEIPVHDERTEYFGTLQPKTHVCHGQPSLNVSLAACHNESILLCLVDFSFIIEAPGFKEALNDIVSNCELNIDIIHLNN
jgi:hypothetical protein